MDLLFFYLSSECFKLFIEQSLGLKSAEKIQKKVLHFFVTALLPILLYTSLFNARLFSDQGLLISILVSSFINGLLFKTGAWGTQRTLSHFFKSAPSITEIPLANEQGFCLERT